MPTLSTVDAADLKTWMSENGWSVRALGSALGVSWRTVQRWRDGSSRVPPMTARALLTLDRPPAPHSPPASPPTEWERVPTED